LASDATEQLGSFNPIRYILLMSSFPDLTPEETDAIVALLQRAIRDDPFPFAPRLQPIKSALAKLAPQPERKLRPPPPKPGNRPRYGKGGSAKRARRNPVAVG
jgi:hypothetical protein